MADDDQDAVPTPRQTGAYARAPIFRAAMLELADRLDGLALRKSRVLGLLDISGAQDCRVAAGECRRLADRFVQWLEDPDMSPTDRIRDYEAFQRVQAQGKALGVADWATFR